MNAQAWWVSAWDVLGLTPEGDRTSSSYQSALQAAEHIARRARCWIVGVRAERLGRNGMPAPVYVRLNHLPPYGCRAYRVLPAEAIGAASCCRTAAGAAELTARSEYC